MIEVAFTEVAGLTQKTIVGNGTYASDNDGFYHNTTRSEKI